MAEPENFCFQHYGTGNRILEVKALVAKRLSDEAQKFEEASPSYIGIQSKGPPINLSWGLSGDEIRLASSAAHVLEGFGLSLFYAVVSDKNAGERAMRECIRQFKSALAKEQQRRHRLPMSPAYVEILEGEPAVHSNILFPLSDTKRAERWITSMSSSILFPGDTLDIQDAEGAQWFVSYCSKERVSKAKYVGGAGAL